MASPILPSLGLGSGINTTAIVTALVAADKEPKQNQIDRQKATNTASISAVSTLKSALASYQASLDKLKSTTTPAFLGFTATSADPKTVTAVADNSAVSGSYSVTVGNLATSSKVATTAFTGGATAAVPAGTLVINQNGVDYPVTVGANATLQSVRDSINSTLASKGITANIIDDGSGARMVFGSTTTGAGSDISVSGIAGFTVDGKVAATKDPVTKQYSAGYVSAQALDAQFSVDGMSMTSKSNDVKSISGITFTLVAPTPTTPATPTIVTVGNNTDGLKASVQSYVDAYNSLVKTVNNQTKTTTDASGNVVQGPMTGDPAVRSLLTAMRNELATSTAGSPLGVLSQLGVNTLQADGTLEFNSTTFNTAIKDKALGSSVQTLFTGTGGLLERMSSAIDPFLKSGGLLDDRTKSLTSTQKSLSNDQAALDARVAAMTTSLTKKYNAMDVLVGQLKATASNITSMFDAMNAQKNA